MLLLTDTYSITSSSRIYSEHITCSNCPKFDTARPWVLRNKPVKYEAARTNGSRDIRITDGQINSLFRKKKCYKILKITSINILSFALHECCRSTDSTDRNCTCYIHGQAFHISGFMCETHSGTSTRGRAWRNNSLVSSTAGSNVILWRATIWRQHLYNDACARRPNPVRLISRLPSTHNGVRFFFQRVKHCTAPILQHTAKVTPQLYSR